MKRLIHYENTFMPELRDLVEGDALFTVLYDVLSGDCNDIFTDGENIIICYSAAPYPVWVWCKDEYSLKNLMAISECVKENFPLTEHNVIMSHGLIDKLACIDKYYEGYKIKTNLLVYSLDKICNIQKCDGKLEIAEAKDLETLAMMWQESAFEMEGYQLSLTQCLDDVEYMIDNEMLYAWRNYDGEIVSIACMAELGIFNKISGVYTVPHHRRCGYAINLVRRLTELILNKNLTPVLYTNGEYIPSNDCYKKIGYYQVGRLKMITK